ncbi:cation:proton antiporter [Euzebya rosea]|uniref:cation:proton antiporter n=1 Tax=Euzebya rosea TaxID=2052804 RepID=UPI000D3EA068|nr:cation:proton antiporter [Euzebya rosea]
MPIHLPDLPLTHAGWVFALLFAVMLVVPIVAERVRVPAIVGLILAGTLIGPTVLGLVERAGAVELLGSAGLLYLMFLAGVELDLEEFKAHRKDSLVFGVATFAVPMAISVVAVWALGYSPIAAVLIASCWASHTLLAYPLFRRFGTQSSRAVATSVGATIITDTAALLVLVVVVAVNGGDVGASFWVTLLLSLAVLLALLMVGLPILARWFFTGIGQDRGVRFGFVLFALFASAGLAELAGVEAIIGAFLAGLSLNRLVPAGSLLMERLEFLGGQLLIPLFLISVGMLVDPAVLADPATLGIAVAFIAMALAAKFVAAWLAGRILGYDRTEIGAMFALSGAQAAATLAAIIVGFDVGLIDADTVNAVVLVILVTCLTTSWVAGEVAPRLPRPDKPRMVGDVVVVPVARPESRLPLLTLAAIMAARDSGTVVPLTVLGPEADQAAVAEMQVATAESEQMALAAGAEAHGLVRIDATPSAGILHTVVEHRGSLLVLGWKGWTSAREALFGGIVDQVLTEAPVPLLLGRLANHQPRGILLVASSANTTPAGISGLRLALAAAARIAKHHQVEVRVLAGSEDRVIREEVLRALGAEVVITVDERRPSIAARDHVIDGDLVVVPVKPDRSGLNGVAARMGRALPDHDLLVALDARSLVPEASPLDTTTTAVEQVAKA